MVPSLKSQIRKDFNFDFKFDNSKKKSLVKHLFNAAIKPVHEYNENSMTCKMSRMMAKYHLENGSQSLEDLILDVAETLQNIQFEQFLDFITSEFSTNEFAADKTILFLPRNGINPLFSVIIKDKCLSLKRPYRTDKVLIKFDENFSTQRFVEQIQFVKEQCKQIGSLSVMYKEHIRLRQLMDNESQAFMSYLLNKTPLFMLPMPLIHPILDSICHEALPLYIIITLPLYIIIMYFIVSSGYKAYKPYKESKAIKEKYEKELQNMLNTFFCKDNNLENILKALSGTYQQLTELFSRRIKTLHIKKENITYKIYLTINGQDKVDKFAMAEEKIIIIPKLEQNLKKKGIREYELYTLNYWQMKLKHEVPQEKYLQIFGALPFTKIISAISMWKQAFEIADEINKISKVNIDDLSNFTINNSNHVAEEDSIDNFELIYTNIVANLENVINQYKSNQRNSIKKIDNLGIKIENILAVIRNEFSIKHKLFISCKNLLSDLQQLKERMPSVAPTKQNIVHYIGKADEKDKANSKPANFKISLNISSELKNELEKQRYFDYKKWLDKFIEKGEVRFIPQNEKEHTHTGIRKLKLSKNGREKLGYSTTAEIYYLVNPETDYRLIGTLEKKVDEYHFCPTKIFTHKELERKLKS